MKNYKREGYSVPEVGQIIGKTPATVRSYIDKGELKAFVGDKKREGGKRSFRISREQLHDFLLRHDREYDDVLICQFAPTVIETTKPKIDRVRDRAYGDPAPTAAWAGLLKPEVEATVRQNDLLKPEVKASMVTQREEVPANTTKETTYSVIVNGRISVANVQKDTAKTILKALLDDEAIDITSIEVRKA